MQFCSKEEDDPSSFKGVLLSDITNLEECFEVDIFVYKLCPTEPGCGIIEDLEDEIEPPTLSAQLVHRSLGRYKNQKMFLNLNKKHFSLIKDIKLYASCWKCESCARLIRRHNNYSRHIMTCTGSVQKVYKGGGFGPMLTVFDKLADEGICFEPEDHYYPYRIVFDYEAKFVNKEIQNTPKIEYQKELVPVSFSIVSNVPGFENPECTINDDPNELIEQFLEQLSKISAAARELMTARFSEVIDEINEHCENAQSCRATLTELKRSNSPAEQVEEAATNAYYEQRWMSLKQDWEKWLNQIPVLGFNSAKFDINLIRQYFVPCLLRLNIEISPPIVRGSSYMMIATKDLLFLDITNYLAAGVSYSAWLKGFGVEEEKGIFPYESADQLSATELPDKSAFYSTLRNSGITDEEYMKIKNVWLNENFSTMRDLLIWYNNKDVKPFLAAVDKMVTIMKEMNIDMFKSGNISLPGLAMVHMFQNVPPDIVYETFGPSDAHLRDKIQNNIVGGASIIYKRFAMKGVGTIKHSRNVPKAVLGYDANALYNWCIGQEMPTGIAVIWEPVNIGTKVPTAGPLSDKDSCISLVSQNDAIQFRRHSAAGFSEWMYVCCTFEAVKKSKPGQQLTVRHKFNGGQKSFQFGKFTNIHVDGWIPELRMIIQYHGCYWHGHQCHKTRNVNPVFLENQRKHHDKIRALLQNTGSTIVEEYECVFEDKLKALPRLRDFVESHRVSSRQCMTQGQIVNSIVTGSLFGMVEVDIQVSYLLALLLTSGFVIFRTVSFCKYFAFKQRSCVKFRCRSGTQPCVNQRQNSHPYSKTVK